MRFVKTSVLRKCLLVPTCEPPDLPVLLGNGLVQSDLTKIMRKLLCLLWFFGFFCKDGKLKIFVLKSAHLAVRCSVSSSLNEQVTYCVSQLRRLKLVDLLHVTIFIFCCSSCSLSPCYYGIWVLLSQFP